MDIVRSKRHLWMRILCCLLSLMATRVALAQQVASPPSELSPQISRERLALMEEELNYLRARESERQAVFNSPGARFPAGSIAQASNQYPMPPELPAPPETIACDALDLPSEQYASSYCSDLCYPCECPVPPAPCIDCPHVTTLNPYFNVRVFGALKLDMILGKARAISPGTPFFLFPGPNSGFRDNYVSIHARQSTLGAAFQGPQFAGFQSGGMVAVMFFNDSVIADRYGILPLQAYGELTNQDWRFAAGLQFDVFSPAMPTMLPFSALAGSGNVGNSFRGQIRLEHFIHVSNEKQWTWQLALSEPIVSTINPDFRILEDNGWPNVEGRIALGLGELQGQGPAAKRPMEIGASTVLGQLRTTDPGVRQVVANVFGLSTDFRWRWSETYGMVTELYTGQGLGTYNGAVLQNINTSTLHAIRSSGGFGEFYVYWTPCLHSHFGYGLDNPLDRDVNNGGRRKNSTLYANALWDINSTFRIGLELTYRETTYAGANSNRGTGVQTQLQWAF